MSEDKVYHIFIIKSKSDSLKSAENFLHNRGWTVASGTNMREALAYIIQKQPQIVMIAADHPNKKVAVLPKLLSQAFPVKIIAFTENTASNSGIALRNMNQPYSIFAPVSGPQILRVALKIYKEEEERRADPNYVSSFSQNSSIAAQEIFKLAGELNADQLQNSVDQAQSAIQHMGPSDSNKSNQGNMAYMPTQSDTKSENSEMYHDKGAKGKNPNSLTQEGNGGDLGSYNPQGETHGKEETSTSSGQSMDKIGNHLSQNPTNSGSNGSYLNKEPASHPFAEQNQPDELEKSDWKSSVPNGKTETEEKNKSTSDKLKKYRDQKKAAPVMESEYVPKGKKKSALYIRGNESADDSSDSIFIKGAKQSIDESVTVNSHLPEDKINKIENSSNMACITINSPKFSGYLVAALGKNRKIDAEFIKMIKQRLFGFLKSNGESIKDDESMDIEVRSVDFEGWAIEQAEFLRKSVHNEDEIALAFFPTKDSDLKTEDSKDEKMIKINLDEFKHDYKVEFNMYMYMPENDKYLLYTPKGNTFYANQKSRLKDKGIEHMHLKKENIVDMKRYKAQNFLNDKIESFLNSKKSQKSS